MYYLMTAVLGGLIYQPEEIMLVGVSQCTIVSMESQGTVQKPFHSNKVAKVEEH